MWFCLLGVWKDPNVSSLILTSITTYKKVGSNNAVSTYVSFCWWWSWQIQCKKAAKDSKEQKIDVCGRLNSKRTIWFHGLLVAVCNTWRKEIPPQGSFQEDFPCSGFLLIPTQQTYAAKLNPKVAHTYTRMISFSITYLLLQLKSRMAD